jgi:hypothetical protein
MLQKEYGRKSSVAKKSLVVELEWLGSKANWFAVEGRRKATVNVAIGPFGNPENGNVNRCKKLPSNASKYMTVDTTSVYVCNSEL